MGNESQQANLVLGFQAPSFHSPEYFPFRVLNTLLNGMGGRLFVELREKRSLAYSVFASHDAGARAGIYQIYIGCAPDKVERAQTELLKVLSNFIGGDISRAELDRAKTYMIGLYQMGFQSNRSQVHSYARYEMSGMGAPGVEKFPAHIREVTLDQIRKVAGKYLDTPNKTWVLLTPSKDSKKIKSNGTGMKAD
jgi:zinc protease